MAGAPSRARRLGANLATRRSGTGTSSAGSPGSTAAVSATIRCRTGSGRIGSGSDGSDSPAADSVGAGRRVVGARVRVGVAHRRPCTAADRILLAGGGRRAAR